MNPVEEIVNLPPFNREGLDNDAIFNKAIHASFEHHYRNCPEFKCLCRQKNFSMNKKVSDIADYPYFPAGFFKNRTLRSVPGKAIRSQLLSSATSGIPSQIQIDSITSKRQILVSAKVIADYIGRTRRPFLIVDTVPTPGVFSEITARSAATRGFLIFASSVEYLMEEREQQMTVNLEKMGELISRFEKRRQEVCLFGFTYILYSKVIKPMIDGNRCCKLPNNSRIIHIGGWKKLENLKVSRSTFLEDTERALGISADGVYDFYGFTEQMGLVYANRSVYPKTVPSYSRVIVRDFQTLKPVRDGENGLLQFLSPLPFSYPGVSVLTEDIGRVVARDREVDGRMGTHFEVVGRAVKAEPRGCGDILGQMMESQ